MSSVQKFVVLSILPPIKEWFFCTFSTELWMLSFSGAKKTLFSWRWLLFVSENTEESWSRLPLYSVVEGEVICFLFDWKKSSGKSLFTMEGCCLSLNDNFGVKYLPHAQNYRLFPSWFHTLIFMLNSLCARYVCGIRIVAFCHVWTLIDYCRHKATYMGWWVKEVLVLV